ncbi:CcdB family protein [Caenimonas terrae]|uniref:Toxin CcdB n=1 Tax=Caenimonas terrae TaxID=696074 RepID=A0ABW0NGT3_9BURK
MPQFDIYANPNVAQREIFPYVVQIQHDFFDALPTRLVVPLQRARNPVGAFPTETVRVGGEALFIAAHLTAALPARLLRHPVANAHEQHALLRDALDAVVSGV